jgi:glutathione S-transferase
MRLYTSIGPDPRVVRMFMAERGIALPTVDVNIRGGENREAAFVGWISQA